MEEIDLAELMRYFWNKKLYIILITFVCLLLGFVYSSFIQKPLYQSYTTILLTKEDDTNSINVNDINLNKNLVDVYSVIIKSKKIMKTVINNLELDYSVNELIKKVNVESVNDTEIIKITVTDKNAALAKNIANEIAEVFNTEIYNYYKLQNTGIVDEAEISNTPYNINLVKEIAISFLIGLVLSFGIIFVIYYFDTTIKSSEEIERKLELPVIGSIPKMGGK